MCMFLLKQNEKCGNILSHPKFIELKKEKFDLVIIGWFMNDFLVGVASHFNCSSIINVSTKPNLWVRNYVGNPQGISFLPSSLQSYKGPMNFQQRLVNLVSVAMEYFMTLVFEYYAHRPIYNRHFPSPQYPSYDEARKNIALVLVNHHFSQGTLEANLPAMVEVAGMHINSTTNELPKVFYLHIVINHTF